MAGNCRPSQCINSKEAKFTLLSSMDRENSGSYQTNDLFDGISTGTWMANVFYWETVANFIEIKVDDDFNIYRSGTSYSERIGKLRILYKANISDTYIDVTAQYVQNISHLSNNQWELYISNMKKGIYKFIGGYDSTVNRIDSEWFLESLSSNCLIYKDNSYYTVSDLQYDIITKEYKPIITNGGNKATMFEENSLSLSELTKTKTINNETFKPIDKLLPFKIQKLE